MQASAGRVQITLLQLADIPAGREAGCKSLCSLRDVRTQTRDLSAVDDARVRQLADSMNATGLQAPITFFQGEDTPNGVDLVAGDHRLVAARLLGWEWIDAIFL